MKENSLQEKWQFLLQENPKLRIRDAAEKLGVSEAQLLATNCGNSVTRLKPEFQSILERVPELGKVMALTRNADVVHEKIGTYPKPSFFHGMGLFNSEVIDLRLFLSHWHLAFGVSEEDEKGEKKQSLQFFDQDGTAVHKIYLKDPQNGSRYEKLVEEFASDDQSTDQEVTPLKESNPEIPDAEIDQEGFRKAWTELKDTHDFVIMLKKFKVTRTQALRLIGEKYAYQIEKDSARVALSLAKQTQTPIMVFAGNEGCIQIHTGEVKKLVEFGEWYNVLDPDFNLHFRETSIDKVWVVKKPTEDGMVTSVEVYDQNDYLIVQFFGKRKPGIAELQEWRDIVEELEPFKQINLK